MLTRMKITIISTEGKITIDDMPGDNALDLADDLKLKDFIQVNLDGESTVLLNPAHIVRVDMDPTE